MRFHLPCFYAVLWGIVQTQGDCERQADFPDLDSSIDCVWQARLVKDHASLNEWICLCIFTMVHQLQYSVLHV